MLVLRFFCWLILSCGVLSGLAYSHGGATNKQGCHHQRSTGGYHCHNHPAASPLEAKVGPHSRLYQRAEWRHWLDEDGDCINTRHEILIRDAITYTLSPDGCKVVTGRWLDPFSGKILTDPSDLDIDHIVPLKWANGHGGSYWSNAKKAEFANNPNNLIAVDDSLNQQKGAKSPSEWLPPNHAFHTQYRSLWLQVVREYQLME